MKKTGKKKSTSDLKMDKMSTSGIMSLENEFTKQFREVFGEVTIPEQKAKPLNTEAAMKAISASMKRFDKAMAQVARLKATVYPDNSNDDVILNSPDSYAYKTMQNYEDTDRLAKLGIKKSPKFRSSFFKLNSFLTTFIRKMDTYKLTTVQLKVLSYVSFQGELELADDQLTITKIAEGLGEKFTTVQRCVEKLGSGYAYSRDGKLNRIDGCGFLKNEKPDGGREGTITITTKGRNFLEGIAELISGYGAKDQTPFLLTTTLTNSLDNLQQVHGLAQLARLGIEQGLFDKYFKGKEK